MASGWAPEGAVQEQIDASIEDAVKEARAKLAQGKSLSHCEECEAVIPEQRRLALPGVRYCVSCQSEVEKLDVISSSFNRRGSKDSQLR
ncbi:MAG: DksA/TraR family C4-type zinc finger protein [Gammaproteobacteria bacterium]|nr:DksA/TraR family C4-type zinc finger protein [Gammaproteobacteria bacterium]